MFTSKWSKRNLHWEQSYSTVHGQPVTRIEPRPLASSPSVLTNTLTCTVRLYCNYSCSLNKKYRQFGELAFQVSIFERELHACMRDLVQTSAREGTFQKREFPAFLDITFSGWRLSIIMCIVPVPVQLYSSTGYLVPVPVRSGERRARFYTY